MPYYTDYGKAILPAGEVGEYVVCPESWRLKFLEKKAPLKETSKEGGVNASCDSYFTSKKCS